MILPLLKELEELSKKLQKDELFQKADQLKNDSKNQAKNLEQAKNAETILTKSYESGTIDFKDVLDIQELQLKFQISQIEAVKSYYMQSAIINYLTQQ